MPSITTEKLAAIASLTEPHMVHLPDGKAGVELPMGATGTTNGTIVDRTLTINCSLPTPDFIEYNGVRFTREKPPA